MKTAVTQNHLQAPLLNGLNGFRMAGVAAGGQFGWSVSSTGDVNGDGITDLIVGALAVASY